MNRFDLFTDSAQDAAMRALEIMRRYGHSLVETEHLLLALIEQDGGTVPELLRMLDVDPATIVQQLNRELPRLKLPSLVGNKADQAYITERLKRVIDKSNQEAARLKNDHISTEHLFLGMAHEWTSATARIMTDAGLTKTRILDAIAELNSKRETSANSDQESSPGRLRVDLVKGDNPTVVLSQGDAKVLIPLQDTLALIAVLAQATAALMNLQGNAEPTEGEEAS
jgi:ATP-dependent Clp protease ATP-binding subunit ClpA